MIQKQKEEQIKNFKFENTFAYKLIYVFRLPSHKYKTHIGLLKIGDTTVNTDKNFDSKELQPNSSALNQAAKERIKEYSNTLGISPELLYTEIAVYKDSKENIIGFRDHDVHEVLENSNIKKQKVNDTTGKEWFKTDLETIKKAISAVKQGKKTLSANEISKNNTPIEFRDEQKQAIDKTVKKFKVSNKMLWNAKMRFGKTLCALQVVKEIQFKKTLIISHRPVVDTGWFEDFNKIFYDSPHYYYNKKDSTETIKDLLKAQKHDNTVNFIYFASVQDLRGSTKVGGKFNKNEELFSLDWDCVIIDEAHEGTTTELGENVKKELIKEKTKLLELSGTPFKIQENYEEDETYTWDYIDEQKAKEKWNKEHYGDYNPYSCLPKLNIYTYDLGKVLHSPAWVDIEDKSFNFKEFFRVWTGDKNKDRRQMPANVKKGSFVYEKDIEKFLTLISKENNETNYPYSKEEYRKLFKHSLWIVPGVKEAKALKELMQKNDIFGSTAFNIVNVAGEGDEDDGKMEDLQKVKSAIKKALENDSYTITLSCGKLTTGVTVPQWTAVMYLAGSYSTTPERYLQTIFRVQTPATINGKEKQNCYVFDFAPDRTLKILAKATHLSTKAGKTNTESEEQRMGELLNFCPVLSISGTRMKKYNVPRLMEKLKDVYAERAVQNGFEDTKIYNEELFKLDKDDLKLFEDLKKIVGTTKPSSKIEDIDINVHGLTEEEREKLKQAEKKKKKKELTPEEKALLEKQKQIKENRNKAISILRAISVRMPLLIYGADVNIEEDISIEDLPNKVDDNSWNEFMPTGVTKEIFKKFVKYYDKHIFILAGKKIRNIVKRADDLPILERIQEITKLFSYFKNPDKETVLTPWRVVNRHMIDCLGGYNFYDEKYENTIEEPLFVNQEQVTYDTLANPNAQILEINSKTGLYPLFVTYSIFKTKCKNKDLSLEEQDKLWEQTIKENVFVICKTPMAKSITQRTLMGFKDTKINAHYFKDLINTVENKSEQFVKRVLNPNYWNIKGGKDMNFDAVVGNPPYQESFGIEGSNSSNAKSIYNIFISASIKLNPKYVSLIVPSRWMTKTSQGIPDVWVDEMLKSNKFKVIHDFDSSSDIFPNVEIKGGVCYFLLQNDYNDKCIFRYYSSKDKQIVKRFDYLDSNNIGIVIRDTRAIQIISKIIVKEHNYLENEDRNFSGLVSPKHFFDNSEFLTSNWKDYSKSKTKEFNIKYYVNKITHNLELDYAWIKENQIPKNIETKNLHKIYIPTTGGSGNDTQVLGYPFYGEPNSICSQTYLVIGYDKDKHNFTKNQCLNIISYIKTRFFRYLVSIKKKTQNGPRGVYQFVPLQNFTNKSDINWNCSTEEIDKQLYKKYKLSDEEIKFIESMIKPME